MTFIIAQPYLKNSWEDVCYPVSPVWLADMVPDYDIMATARQRRIVGQGLGGLVTNTKQSSTPVLKLTFPE